MNNKFFHQPILNSPYEYPARHWALDEDGLPMQIIKEQRRKAAFITPVPGPRQRGQQRQANMTLDSGDGLSTGEQEYSQMPIINELRRHVDDWRRLPNVCDWQVTSETAMLLTHWRHHAFHDIRPFFCQVEAAEVVIWLTEVAPKIGKRGKRFLEHLHAANAAASDATEQAPPALPRLALKLATGAGKTTVMAMLIAWQAINAARQPNSRRFTKGFLIVTPGITIKDRLRVLQPNDPGSYYQSRELVPNNMLHALQEARIVITNYHAFKRRERLDISKGGRALLQGKGGAPPATLESDGQMLQRVIPELLGLQQIMVLNDEAHHCYREKPGNSAEGRLKGDDKAAAASNNEAARLWLSGLEAIAAKLDIARVLDLSATPFFLRGAGYPENTLFPWTMSDFSLMDAIECGIVKLPRVPVADNIPGDSPMYRQLWAHIAEAMPRKGRRKAGKLDPQQLPAALQTALAALYGHYEQTSALWQKAGKAAPPCFIIVCNNTASSKLVYDYIAGFQRENADGSTTLVPGRLELFRNFDEQGRRLARPHTLLIDSEQLESGEALDKNFRQLAATAIEQFQQDRARRGIQGELGDAELLREVMNTVGRPGALGGSIRCVVSVAMLTEGWDANTVTHILGVRAFGTQLLCEQVVGRALRRQSYALNEAGLFDVEYADVLGIPFDFTAEPVVAPAKPPPDTVQVKAMRPERDALEIRFPRVVGYRTEPPADKLTATFNADHRFELTPDLVGATETLNEGLIGEAIDLTLAHLDKVRRATVLFELTRRLLLNHYRDADGAPKLYLFGQLKRITRQWLDGYLVCKGGTHPAQLMYQALADMACERITAAITQAQQGQARPVKAMLDAYNPSGSTAHVNFTSSKPTRWAAAAHKCHLNWIICDGNWEAEFCRVAEAHERVLAYVKNHGLGLEVPYRYQNQVHRYRPDFIVQIDDGQGRADPLNLIVEIKGRRNEQDKDKKLAIEEYWIPGVNNLGGHGRWAFAEFTDVYQMQQDFGDRVEIEFGKMVRNAMTGDKQ